MPSYGEVGTMAMTMTKEKEKGILTVRLNIGLEKKICWRGSWYAVGMTPKSRQRVYGREPVSTLVEYADR